MAAPEYVVQLIIQGRDEASQALKQVYQSLQRSGETIEQGKQRWREYTQEIRQLTKAQSYAHQAFKEQHDVMLGAMDVVGKLGSAFGTLTGMLTRYTVMMIRVEQAQKAVVEAQKKLNEAESDYLEILYKVGVGSEEAKKAHERVIAAQKELEDAQRKVNEITDQNRIAFVMFGFQMLTMVGHARSLMLAMNQLRISMSFAAASSGVTAGAMSGAGAAAGTTSAAVAGLSAKLAGLAAPLTLGIGLLAAIGAALYVATQRTNEGRTVLGEYAYEWSLLNKQLIAGIESNKYLYPAIVELYSAYHISADELANLTGLTREQIDAEIAYGNYAPILTEAVKNLLAHRYTEAEIIEELTSIQTKYLKGSEWVTVALLDEAKAREIVRAATQDQLRETVRLMHEQGAWVEDAIKYVEEYTGSLLVARGIVREFYGNITTNAQQAAQAQAELVKAQSEQFEKLATQLPRILQGFDMGERTIAGMAEEARTRFAQMSEVIREVTGVLDLGDARKWFATAIKGMGVDVGDFERYTEEQLSMLYVMMQENPALIEYLWTEAMQAMGDETISTVLEAGLAVEGLTQQWGAAEQAVKDYVSEVEKAGGVPPAFEPEYLPRLREITIGPLVEQARERGAAIPRLGFGYAEYERQLYAPEVRIDQPVEIGPFYVSKEVDIDALVEEILRRLLPRIISPYAPRGVT